MNTKHRNFMIRMLFFAVSACLIGLDQWTKQLAVQYLKEKEPIVLVKGIFELTYLENRGAAFGIFQNQRILFLCITLVIIAAVLYAFFKIPENWHFLPFRLILTGIFSGAVGNMVDRFFHGYVIDFCYFRLIDFPVFNIADIYVTVSTACMVVLLMFFYKEEDFAFLSR